MTFLGSKETDCKLEGSEPGTVDRSKYGTLVSLYVHTFQSLG